jgi:AcrR family transcriptional regulator
MSEASTRRGPGRPRDQAATRAIHQAALDLLERHGYGALTIDGIARLAGTGRQTIYRRWPTKADVVLDALNARAASDITATDLTAFIRSTYANAPRYQPVLSGLMAHSQLDPAFAARFRAGFIDRRRAALAEIVRRELPGADVEVAADLVFGPLWYLILTGRVSVAPDRASHVLAAVVNLG